MKLERGRSEEELPEGTMPTLREFVARTKGEALGRKEGRDKR